MSDVKLDITTGTTRLADRNTAAKTGDIHLVPTLQTTGKLMTQTNLLEQVEHSTQANRSLFKLNLEQNKYVTWFNRGGSSRVCSRAHPPSYP